MPSLTIVCPLQLVDEAGALRAGTKHVEYTFAFVQSGVSPPAHQQHELHRLQVRYSAVVKARARLAKSPAPGLASLVAVLPAPPANHLLDMVHSLPNRRARAAALQQHLAALLLADYRVWADTGGQI